MRLKKLTIQAFGPFKDKIVIDFENNNINKGILLITGDTGSGKTTIFDAICFALYGYSSSQIRITDSLRSDYAKEDIETYVELEFYYKNKLYIVNRSPEYKRKSKRGDKIINSLPQATIEINNVKITKYNEVTKAITELLGLDYQQFRQVAMLSQGEFTNFLLANSKEKTNIFRKIFNTEFYDKFQNKLKSKKIEFEQKLEYIKEKIKEEINKTISIINLENFNQEEIIDKLQEKLYLIKNDLEDTKEKREKLNEKYYQIKNKIEKIQETNKKIKLLNESNNNLEQLINSTNINDLEQTYNYNIAVARLITEQINLKEKEENQLNYNNEKLDDFKIKLNKIELSINENKTIFDKLDDYPEEINKINKNIITNKELLNNYNNYLDLKNNLDYKKLNEIIKEYQKETSIYEELRIKYYLNISVTLADTLKDNEPCPVCGSKVHPNISKEKNSITKEDVEKQETKVNKLNDIRKKLESKIELINQKLEKYHFDFDVSDKINKIKLSIKSLEIKLEDYKKEYQLNISLKNNLTKNKIEVTQQIKLYNDLIKNNKVNIKNIQLKLNNIYINNKTNYDEYISKYKDDKILQTIQTNIKEYYKTKDHLEGIISTLKEFSNQKIVDVIDLQNKLDDIFKKYQEVDEKYNNYNNEYVKLNLSLENFKNYFLDYNKINDKYKDIKILSDTANGNLVGKQKITFENYVQSYYLNYVIIEANKRLGKMTDNRYKLVKKISDKLNIKTGLDFDVYDAYTGKNRDVVSLSGGEKFKASLALALGLSDVISNNAGGIKIDSLFIDEGFGSLDSESLSQAINVLEDLSNNDKLIGVVSHINELKSQITNKIIVRKSINGSSISIERF